MRKKFSNPIVFAVALAIGISLSATAALAWDAPTHAYIAREGLPYGGYVCGYWARIGSVAPDFAWYLGDFRGLEGADELHDEFLDYVSKCTRQWNFTHRCFKYGAASHLCADPYADASIALWREAFPAGVDEQALHLALESAVGSLIEGLQLGDLIFLYGPARFMECVVSDYLGGSPPFDIEREFKTYMALMRMLEKAGKVYAPFLRGDVGEEFLNQIDISDLLPESFELSDEALSLYLEVLDILLTYPDEIYSTITGGDNWRDAVDEVIATCPIP